MALSIGIVGLPNVGKSTAFNALTQAQNAEVANYPFCTIEPNKAIVPVPDARLDALCECVQPKKLIHATIEFVDIAGLVKGASQGEGLGNQFLGNIRETSAIVHVVRCFADENVTHVHESPEPRRDVEIVNTELILADLQQLEKKRDRLAKQVKGDPSLRPVAEMADALKTHLETGSPAITFAKRDSDAFTTLDGELQFLTNKPVIFAANVDEDGLSGDSDYVTELKAVANEQGGEVVVLCAKIEEEMSGMSPEERQEFLHDLGATESGLAQVIRMSYRALKLISFFTAGPKEVRAWTVRDGATAPNAAGVIHSDFERGFIRAEIIPFETYIEDGGETAAKAAGHMRTEGKDYVMHDGDVTHFRFNV